MKKRISLVLMIATIGASAADAQNHVNRRRGAILGGLAGAALGVAIGDKGDNETAGALIGGAVGAVAGGAIGNAKDQQIDHHRRYHSGYPVQRPAYGQPTHSQPAYHDHYQHHSAYPRYRQDYYEPRVYEVQPPRGLTGEDVIAMVRSGLSESMIIRQIQLRGVARKIEVSEVIVLHQQGVSEPIIDAMQGVFPPAMSGVPFREPPSIETGRSYRYSNEVPDFYGPSIVAPAN